MGAARDGATRGCPMVIPRQRRLGRDRAGKGRAQRARIRLASGPARSTQCSIDRSHLGSEMSFRSVSGPVELIGRALEESGETRVLIALPPEPGLSFLE